MQSYLHLHIIAGLRAKLLGAFRKSFSLAIRSFLCLAQLPTFTAGGKGWFVTQDNGFADIKPAPVDDLGLWSERPLEPTHSPCRDPEEQPWSAAPEKAFR